MYQLFHHLRSRMGVQLRAATTFCEDCGSVCTPASRREALREHWQESAQRAGLLFRR